jgi:hypothetical protein
MIVHSLKWPEPAHWQQSGRCRMALVIVGAILCLHLVIAMLQDVEYAGQDVTISGLRIFRFGKTFRQSCSVGAGSREQLSLFPRGIDSIKPQAVVQGEIYDCRFLATVVSLIKNNRGRQLLLSNIKKLDNGDYSVTFAGIGETVVVPPLSPEELSVCARTRDLDCACSGQGTKGAAFQSGIWLPVLEKAYGQYRNTHQDVLSECKRFCKHAIFELRPTCISELPSFGAAFGATDDEAAKMLTGNAMKEYPTFSFECGACGFGKGYASIRQIKSWFDRDGVFKETIAEQDQILRKAISAGRLAVATTEINGDCVAYGLNSGHAYGVIDYDSRTKMLVLVDPYGQGDLRRAYSSKPLDGRDDGIFRIALSDFNALFSHLRLAEP